MKKILGYLKSDHYKLKIKPEVIRTVTVIFFTFIYSSSVIWFLETSNIPLYTSGIPGVSQLIRDFISYVLKIDISAYERVFIGVLTILLNIPILILGLVRYI